MTLVAALALAVLPRRFHLLSRRFLVFVPAGLVVHDHLVLAETALFRWVEVRSVERALAGTTALDLTGGALGAAVEVTLDGEQTVVRAAGRARTPVGRGHAGVPLPARRCWTTRWPRPRRRAARR